ncbi:CoA-disulfide reductase [Metabacillus iocasae]|uniref:NADPH-dependent 2,4-dienoyl-CoA reductase/sulfur reductase-like enzyme n=1 Tax=Priestia iocasae TaxID=2291674 RepID=A0ABS2QZ44_9BACI|nr:CoA-disulfide reductase [Metabacillus iocasae]MBM7704759.1 NADPH-dependent 2,4-dienoyl-CoA reductase/sulfur reductase-like enzyme [Metabacillus iocasae]
MDKVVIIGGVAAGMSAASQLRRLNEEVEIVVFEKGKHVSYGACGLPYYISGIIQDEEELIARTKEEFQKRRIDIHTLHEVVEVNETKKEVVVVDHQASTQKRVSYDKLVIATGTSPIRPPFMKDDMENVFTLKDIEDGVRIRQFVNNEKVKHVTIIGGGYIGLELAESMLELGKSVRVIELNEQILPPFDADMAEIVEEGLKGRIAFHLNEEVKELEGDAHVRTVRTNKGAYETDAVIVNVGVKPNTDFLKETSIKMNEKGAIHVNNRMETSVKDIYAAGDCATSYHLVLNEPVHIALGTIANKQGRILGYNLGNEKKEFPGVVGTSVVKIAEFEVAKTGISEKEAKQYKLSYKTVTEQANSHASYYPNVEKITIKLVYDANTNVLLGAQMIGKTGVAKRIDVFATAITMKLTGEQVSMLDLSYAPPFASVWDAVQRAAQKAT